MKKMYLPLLLLVGSLPLGVSISPAGTSAYVTNSTGTTVSVINTTTNTVTGAITVGSSPAAQDNGSAFYSIIKSVTPGATTNAGIGLYSNPALRTNAVHITGDNLKAI